MVEVHELDAACIRVLRDYSFVEERLAWVLAALLGVHSNDSLRLFQIIRSNDARHKIIAEFLRVKKPEFVPFWQQMRQALKTVDEGRNKVAHWVAVADMGALTGSAEPPDEVVHKLVPPGDVFAAGDVSLRTADVLQISLDARHATRSLMFLWMVLRWEIENPDAEPHLQRGLFLQPVQDPFLATMFQRIAEAHVPQPEAPLD